MTDIIATVRPTIQHRFGPSLWKAAYTLEWDWDNCRWIERLQPERGHAISWSEFINRDGDSGYYFQQADKERDAITCSGLV